MYRKIYWCAKVNWSDTKLPTAKFHSQSILEALSRVTIQIQNRFYTAAISSSATVSLACFLTRPSHWWFFRHMLFCSLPSVVSSSRNVHLNPNIEELSCCEDTKFLAHTCVLVRASMQFHRPCCEGVVLLWCIIEHMDDLCLPVFITSPVISGCASIDTAFLRIH